MAAMTPQMTISHRSLEEVASSNRSEQDCNHPCSLHKSLSCQIHFYIALRQPLYHWGQIHSCLLLKHLLKLPHHIITQRHRSKPLQSLHIHLLCQRCPLPNHLFQVLKVAHEETGCDGVDEDGFLIEWVAELVRETDGDGDKFAGAGVEVAAAWGVETNFSFLMDGEALADSTRIWQPLRGKKRG